MALKVRTSVDGSGFAQGLEKMTQDASHFGKDLSSKIGGNFNQAIMGAVPGLTSAIAGVFAADSIKSAAVATTTWKCQTPSLCVSKTQIQSLYRFVTTFDANECHRFCTNAKSFACSRRAFVSSDPLPQLPGTPKDNVKRPTRSIPCCLTIDSTAIKRR
jgi:hypothetical protein